MDQLKYQDTITVQSGSSIAREWTKNRDYIPANGQLRRIFDELAKLCVAESVRQREDEYGLCNRLDDAYNIINSVWYATAPHIATKFWREGENPSAEEQKRIDVAKTILWARHDPIEAMTKGYESLHYVNFDKSSITSTITDYLVRPWLRHSVLDWIFLDMTISQELCAFGEHVKESSSIGKDLCYFKASGNLQKMKELYFKNFWARFGKEVFWIGIVPVAAIWALYHNNDNTIGGWTLATYALLWFIFLAYKTVRLAAWLFRKATGQLDPNLKLWRLWDDMYAVWKKLEGSVISPTLVREEMRRSTEKGAVWDNVSWSLIDRVIAIDPAVWITETGH